MGVHDKGTIDQLMPGADGKVHLAIYAAGSLGADYSFEDLADKVETYLEFLTEGGFAAQFPDFAKRPPVIRVSCQVRPAGKYKERFARMAAQLDPYDIELVVVVSDLHGPGGTFEFR